LLEFQSDPILFEQYSKYTVNICAVAGYIIDNYICKTDNYSFFELPFDKKTIKPFKEESFYNLLTIYLRHINNSKEVKKEKDIHNGSVLVVKNSLKLKNEDIKMVTIISKHVDTLRNIVKRTEFDRLEAGKLYNIILILLGIFLRELSYEYLHKTMLVGICIDYLENLKGDSYEVLLENINPDLLQQVLKNYEFWYLNLKKENLVHIDDLKPILSVKN